MRGIVQRWIALLLEWDDKGEKLPLENKGEKLPLENQETWLGKPRELWRKNEGNPAVFKRKENEKEERKLKWHQTTLVGKDLRKEGLREPRADEDKKRFDREEMEAAEGKGRLQFWNQEITEKEREKKPVGQWFSAFDTKKETNSLLWEEKQKQYPFSEAMAETEKIPSVISKEGGMSAQEALLSRIYGILAKEKEGSPNSGNPQISLQVGQISSQRDLDSMIQGLSKRLWEERQSSRRKMSGD